MTALDIAKEKNRTVVIDVLIQARRTTYVQAAYKWSTYIPKKAQAAYKWSTYLPKKAQASGAEFDMAMTTKEQETFATALSARDGFEQIRAGLSKVDVRLEVRTRHPPTAAPHRALHHTLACIPPFQGTYKPPYKAVPLSPIRRRSAATTRIRSNSSSSSS